MFCEANITSNFGKTFASGHGNFKRISLKTWIKYSNGFGGHVNIGGKNCKIYFAELHLNIRNEQHLQLNQEHFIKNSECDAESIKNNCKLI